MKLCLNTDYVYEMYTGLIKFKDQLLTMQFLEDLELVSIIKVIHFVSFVGLKIKKSLPSTRQCFKDKATLKINVTYEIPIEN